MLELYLLVGQLVGHLPNPSIMGVGQLVGGKATGRDWGNW